MNRLLVFIFVIANVQSFGQSFEDSTLVNGHIESLVRPFKYVEYFQEFKYVVHGEDDIDLPLINDESFNKKHLESPYLVLQSLLAANSNEWIDEISEIKGKGRITEDFSNYKSSEEFRENYVCKVVSEFYFKMHDKEYCILLSYVHTPEMGNRMYTLVLGKNKNVWKISYDKHLSAFSYFFYLEPKRFKNLLFGNVSYFNTVSPEFFDYYFYGGVFNVTGTKNFGMLYEYSKERPLPNVTIPKDKYFQTNLKFNVSSDEIPHKIGITTDWSKNDGMFFNYETADKRTLYAGSYRERKFDGTPEAAAASWIFSNDLQEMKKYSLGSNGYTNNELKAMGSFDREASMDFDYKIMFYDKSDLYVLMFFHERENFSMQEGGYKVYKYKGHNSILLTAGEDSWRVNLNPSDEIKALVSALSKLNYEGLRMLFSGETTGDPKVDQFFRGVYLGRYPDGTIYINSIYIPETIPSLIKKD
ncbi:hypothetical protein RCC89_18555 [Cytophagaceae bacterium ABcell3]|nr:hypothetical protein RCC89_18555 [Cytophagaceae bacterium ABcell3]